MNFCALRTSSSHAVRTDLKRKQVDDDDSGLITFDELLVVARSKMKISKSDVSDHMMKALWCVLDDDNNNNLDFVEFVSASTTRDW